MYIERFLDFARNDKLSRQSERTPRCDVRTAQRADPTINSAAANCLVAVMVSCR